MKRHEAEAKIKELGGKIASSVNKQLNYLIVGESAGSKVDKAQALIEKGAPIQLLDENAFLQLLS